MDYNDTIDEVSLRRKRFTQWLLKAWEYCEETGQSNASTLITDLVSHADELDYPLWEVAHRDYILGTGLLAHELAKACGVPPDGPTASQWERFINYSPVISLDEKTWRYIHGELGWANRDHDNAMNARNFWLVSNGGNVVRFVVRKEDYGV